MLTCKGCGWSRVASADPRRGVCIFGRHEVGEEESSSGTSMPVIQGKYIWLADQACENYESKKSHKETIKEGY